MNLIRLSLIPVLFTVGCVSVRDFKPVEDRSGLYRTQHRKTGVKSAVPEEVLRDEDRRLVTDASDAARVMARFRRVGDIVDNSRENKCSVKTLYPAKVRQFRARAALARKDWRAVLDELAGAESICRDIDLITPHDYLKAVAYAGLGDGVAARASVARFLTYGAAITPARYTQFEARSAGELIAELESDSILLAKYRARARNFLAGASDLVWDEPAEVPKFYANNPFRPGGSRVGGWMVLPTTIYYGSYGTAFGGVGYYSWGDRSLSTSYVTSSSTGNFVGLRLRQSLYESPNRDTDLDVFAGGHTMKRIRVTERQSSIFSEPERDVKVERQSFDPLVGVGGTYRLKPEFGFAGQLRLARNQIEGRVDLGQSLYVFYDLLEGLSVNAGWIESAPVASVSLMFAQIGYDFRAKQMVVWAQNLSF